MPAHPIRFETETSGMLDLMRKNAGSWVVKALLGAIVVVFVFWGVGSWTSHQEGVVATVDGEAISRQDYTNEYNRIMDQVRQNFGAGITDEMLKSLQLETQALNQLIDRLLLKRPPRAWSCGWPMRSWRARSAASRPSSPGACSTRAAISRCCPSTA